MNIALIIDAYKLGHRLQYEKGTELVYSNWTPRSDAHLPKLPGIYDGKLVWHGLNNVFSGIFKMWDGFFVEDWEVIEAEYRRVVQSMGFDGSDIQHLKDLHELGYLPIKLRALPEGTVVPVGTPCMTVYNTDPHFFWLTNYLEDMLSAELWKASVNATIARQYRKLFDTYAAETSSIPDFVAYQGHDFSLRGMSGMYDAASSGTGHLLFFEGTDNIPAVMQVQDTFGTTRNTTVGMSVPATEHSVMMMSQKGDEFETFKRLITEVYPSGIVSIVSDTWDLWKVVTDFLPRLRDTIMKRDGKVVIRPDSGDPANILCGDPEAEEDTPKARGLIECLWGTFGGTINEKGYKELDPHIGAIYGDSITLERAEDIVRRLKAKGFASTNVVLGIGSYTYNYSTRDSLGWAMKATAGIVNGEVRLLQKDPVTDKSSKKSRKGFLRVDPGFEVVECSTMEEAEGGLLETHFLNGAYLPAPEWNDVKQRANI